MSWRLVVVTTYERLLRLAATVCVTLAPNLLESVAALTLDTRVLRSATITLAAFDAGTTIWMATINEPAVAFSTMYSSGTP